MGLKACTTMPGTFLFFIECNLTFFSMVIEYIEPVGIYSIIDNLNFTLVASTVSRHGFQCYSAGRQHTSVSQKPLDVLLFVI